MMCIWEDQKTLLIKGSLLPLDPTLTLIPYVIHSANDSEFKAWTHEFKASLPKNPLAPVPVLTVRCFYSLNSFEIVVSYVGCANNTIAKT